MKTNKKPFSIGLTAFMVILLASCDGQISGPTPIEDDEQVVKVDDWEFEYNYNSAEYPTSGGGGSFFGGGATTTSSYAPQAAMDMAVEAESDLGFSVGGAKDVANFRENIENGYLPLPTDITHEGIFYDYYFDTGQTEECDELFCPSYSYALSEDPLSGEPEHYLQVGLNSGLKESDFERKKLNLVVVLDISGSMGSPFDQYHYDGGVEVPLFEEGEREDDWNKEKMEVANESVVGLLDHLNEDDRFGMVVFDDDAYLAKPLSSVAETDMESIADHILDLEEHGGTNMEAGMEKGTELFEEFLDADPEEYENRIIFLTDAMPNTGDYSERSLLGMVEGNADDGVSTTFIGIGVDFNTELVEEIGKVRGANYYAVHSPSEFKTRMDDEFEFMVTPLVFDLELKLDAPGYDIEAVYGSPTVDPATGEIMKINTLFPSKQEDGEMRGGVIILKLKQTGDEDVLTLKTTFEDRSGNQGGEEVEIRIEDYEPEHFDNDGIRKGILLTRYVNLMKNWTQDERISYQNDKPIAPVMDYEIGILPPPFFPEYSEWERQSIDLKVSSEYQEMISDFMGYFEAEMEVLEDDTLKQELELMELLFEA